MVLYFFFNDTATTEIYTLSLHDALPICCTPISNSFGYLKKNESGFRNPLRYRWHLAPESEILATATGICPEVPPKRVEMSVRDDVTLYSKLIPYLRKRKLRGPPSRLQDAIPDRPMSQLKKNMRGATCPRGCILVYKINKIKFLQFPFIFFIFRSILL